MVDKTLYISGQLGLNTGGEMVRISNRYMIIGMYIIIIIVITMNTMSMMMWMTRLEVGLNTMSMMMMITTRLEVGCLLRRSRLSLTLATFLLLLEEVDILFFFFLFFLLFSFPCCLTKFFHVLNTLHTVNIVFVLLIFDTYVSQDSRM